MILVRCETTPDDIHGMIAARGDPHRPRRDDLARGRRRARDGQAVRRGLRRPRCSSDGVARVAGQELREGDLITIDGGTGQVFVGAVPLVEPRAERGLPDDPRLGRRASGTSSVRANADNPEDAARAREFGAEGIGLCRTEHMFFGDERLPVVQEMILAEDEPERRAALDRLLPFQQSDFEGIFEAMAGLPVTIRLLDPPLHEFLPARRGDRRAHARPHPRAAGDEPDARHARLPARDPSTPRSTRCRSARSPAPRGRCRSGRATRRSSRSCTRSSATPRSCAGSPSSPSACGPRRRRGSSTSSAR